MKETDSRNMLVGGGGGYEELVFNGIEFLFGMMEKFWKWIEMMVIQHC